MSRILFILVLLVVGFLLLKSWQRKQRLDQHDQQTSGKTTNNTRMVRCLQCGLHVPEQEAISQGGKHFCSLEHATQHLTKN
ncbi:PP0621 family protein [Candidatus Thiothrix sp. Deng01]|uniref:PP0621 family protein n=1 Tax=Candidatus Thiothrix phosphatis TaxID=3112415 RepID=A0ABU6CX86_9GAMM|nr:PP0621 family protein [Candidatus Thiothrix sp. Deng01]MEB4591023.1 PP0621 family protein [Candidatus Thiothrix sp. Deng01]